MSGPDRVAGTSLSTRAAALHRLDTQLLALGSSPDHNKKGNIHAR